MLVRSSMTNLKMTIRADCAIFACNPLQNVFKSFCPTGCSDGGGGWGGGWHREAVGLWTDICPPLQLPASEIKQIFLSTNLACLLALEQQAAQPHSSFTNNSSD